MAMPKIKLTFNIQRDRKALDRFDRNNLRKYFWISDEHHMDVKCCVLNTNCLYLHSTILPFDPGTLQSCIIETFCTLERDTLQFCIYHLVNF